MKATRNIFIILLIALLAGLLIFAIAGSTSRYIQDDYCYAAILRGNFWERQLTSYLQEVTYSANRYSLTLGMGVTELFGPVNVQILPIIVLGLWIIGLNLVLREGFTLFTNEKPDPLYSWLGAASLVFFTLALTPNWIQVFYWRPGMFPYTAPLVVASYAFWLTFRSARIGKVSVISGFLILLLAILAGGFSETAGAVLFSSSILVLFIAIFRKPRFSKLIMPSAIAVSGSTVAMILLMLSPSTALRLKSLYGIHAPWSQVLVNSLKGGVKFYLSLVYNRPLYVLGILLFFIVLGILYQSITREVNFQAKKAILPIVGVCITIYLFTVAAMAPSFYGESAYPGDRALNIPTFLAVLLLGCWGLVLGRLIQGANLRLIKAITALGLLVTVLVWVFSGEPYLTAPILPAIYHFPEKAPILFWILLAVGVTVISCAILRFAGQSLLPLLSIAAIACMAAHVAMQFPVLAFRAEQWDLRNQQILAAIGQGQKDITVRALDSLVGISDLNLDTGHWVNRCSAAYYRIDTITVVEPVLDPVRIEVP